MSDNIRIALWEVNSENPKSPKFNGIVTIDGKEIKVSVWDNKDAQHPKAPRLKGKTSRPAPMAETAEPETLDSVQAPLPF
jgi:hypothetical protein